MRRDWQPRGNRVGSGYIQRLCKPGEGRKVPLRIPLVTAKRMDWQVWQGAG